MYLGIDNHTGLFYEGAGGADTPAIPTPSVTYAKLMEKAGDESTLPRGIHGDAKTWIFREDSFDPVTRVRRGRLYQPHGGSQPQTVRVSPHPYDYAGRWPGVDPEKNFQKTLFVYTSCSQVLNLPGRGMGATLALGSPEAVSYWRIVQTEMLVNQAVMVTLKALSAYDILPELAESKVREDFRSDAKRVMENVLDAAFRESPDSVVDRCRNALTVLMSRWLAQQGHDPKVLEWDLAKVADAIGEKPYERGCPANMGRSLALLHNRGKTNVARKMGLRALVEEDAEFAIQALGLAVRDLGWAKAS